MKLLTLSIAIAFQICTLSPQAVGQDNPAQPERLHVRRPIPASGGSRVDITASEIYRDLSRDPSNVANESIIHLKGNVEVRMFACPLAAKDRSKGCSGVMLMRADAADYNEKTGEINASGNVHITPSTAPYK
jgi:lipopolysaccharide assembly outer membrane protein LptD (OstA)